MDHILQSWLTLNAHGGRTHRHMSTCTEGADHYYIVGRLVKRVWWELALSFCPCRVCRNVGLARFCLGIDARCIKVHVPFFVHLVLELFHLFVLKELV